MYPSYAQIIMEKSGSEILEVLRNSYMSAELSIPFYQVKYCVLHPKHKDKIMSYFLELPTTYKTKGGDTSPIMSFEGIQLVFDEDIESNTFISLNEEMYKEYLKNKRQFNSGLINPLMNNEQPFTIFR